MPFRKGQSGNPGGLSRQRRRTRRHIEELAQAALETERGNVAINELVNIATGTTVIVDDNEEMTAARYEPKDRIRAIELLMAYAYGKPRQRTEITGEDGGPVQTEAAVKIYIPDNKRGRQT